jgi:hypothetical protein
MGLQGGAVGHVDPTGKQFGDEALDGHVLVDANVRRRIDFDEDVDITRRPRFAADGGTELGRAHHAAPTQFVPVLVEDRQGAVAVHGLNLS